MFISKSDYISGVQCPKKLWLSKNHPEVCKNSDSARTQDGDETGALARTYFPGAVTVPLAKAAEMAKATQELFGQGYTTICEATFMANGLSCSADIIRVRPDGSLDVIEVKSSTSVKEVQREDVAFQCYVIHMAGYTINSVYLMHLNKDYVRHGELDVHQLFVLEDLDLSVRHILDDVIERIDGVKMIPTLEHEPCVGIGYHCEKPYDCPCKEYCFKQAGVPERSVFSIAGMSAKKKYELYAAGIVTPEQLCASVGALTARQAEQAKDLLYQGDEAAPLTVNKRAVKEFLDTIQYPLHLLDFETFQRAIPQFEGVSPYTQIPFQYSLHIMKDQTEEGMEHREHLAEAGIDPRRALAEQLCQDIPLNVQSIAYNYSFEKSVCRALAGMYPDLAPHLLNIVENMVDLMVPFQKKWVTSPAMHGSYSIKVVLPTLCGNDPEIDYHALPVVHNGAEAMETFATLHQVEDREQVEEIRQGLLKYCGLDTLAMVKVLERLYELID